ncbi:MAG: polyprenyl synthetase family protein [Mycoplasmatales bacterium]
MLEKNINDALLFHFIIPVKKTNILKGDELLFTAISNEKDIKKLKTLCIKTQTILSEKIKHQKAIEFTSNPIDEIEIAIDEIIDDIPCYFTKYELKRINNGKKKKLRSNMALKIMEIPNFKALALIELFHLATLIQDDIIDRGIRRRFEPTINYKYDDYTALLVSDILLCQIFLEFNKLFDKVNNNDIKQVDDDIEKIIRDEFSSLIIGMLNSEKNNRNIKTLKQYEKSANDKTGKLFGFSLVLGCLYDEKLKNENSIKDYYEYGCDIGVIFQKVDDYLDIYATVEKIGKNSQDSVNGINNFVTILLSEKNCKEEIKEILLNDLKDLESNKLSKNFCEELEIIKGSIYE